MMLQGLVLPAMRGSWKKGIKRGFGGTESRRGLLVAIAMIKGLFQSHQHREHMRRIKKK